MDKEREESDLYRRIHNEMLDGMDEELELELEDFEPEEGSLARRSSPEAKDKEQRQIYFRELLRLQCELVRLQDWVVEFRCMFWM